MNHPAMSAISQILAKALPPAGTPQAASRDYLQPVEQVQARTLTPGQLDAIARIQDGLRTIMEIEQQINLTMAAERLQVEPLKIYACGDLWHQFEGLLFGHNIASAKLRNGAAVVAKQKAAKAA
ncbi:hypothetical protein [Aquitalea magnusonii]|nr:hypothetical protein [Aquitalea magnusonii]